MATHGARRLLTMTGNALNIVAIEFLAACQGIDLRAPLKTSARLQGALRARCDCRSRSPRATGCWRSTSRPPRSPCCAPEVQSLANDLVPSYR